MVSSLAGREKCRQGAERAQGISLACSWYLSHDSGSSRGEKNVVLPAPFLTSKRAIVNFFLQQLFPEHVPGTV